MPTPIFQALRSVLIVLLATLTKVVVTHFDKMNEEEH